MQMALAFTTESRRDLDSKRDRILAVLRSGRWVGGEEFMDGRHGFYCSSYSQRIGQLIRAGHHIERDRNHGGIARYRLTEEASCVPQ